MVNENCYKLLEHLSQAYEDPEYVAKSKPLFTIDFNKIDDFMAASLKKLSWKDQLLSSISFIVFILNCFFQNQNNLESY